MVRRLVRRTVLTAALAVGWSLTMDGSGNAQAQVLPQLHATPDLFYNFYVPPGPCGGPAAALYPSPRPAPPWIGHTYVTYQPLMPHEFLYRHHRSYWRYNPDGKWTHVFVSWQ
jgi:hypothetical protein